VAKPASAVEILTNIETQGRTEWTSEEVRLIAAEECLSLRDYQTWIEYAERL
jgi:hypothetical protein